MSLINRLKKIANEHPGTRRHLVPIIKQSSNVLYHGTSASEFDRFRRLIYLTKSKPDAWAFAKNPIIGGGRGRGKARVLSVNAPSGRTKNIDMEIIEALDYGDDIDQVIEDQAKDARKKGYKYLSFNHPSVSGSDFQTLIALNPTSLKIVNTEYK